RPQRGCILPDRGIPRNDVLLRPAPGAAAAVELSLFDRQFLGTDIDLYVGGTASSTVYGASRLGAVARNGILADSIDAELGIRGERPDDVQRLLASAQNRSRGEVHGGVARVLRGGDPGRIDDGDQD